MVVFFCWKTSPLSFFLWGMFFFFTYSGLLFLYHQTLHMDEEKLNRYLLEQQISLYKQEFQAIQHTQNQIHSLRHDWSNHLMLLSEYIYARKYPEAQDYISQLKENIRATYNYSNTGNYDVDCILNYYLAKAEEYGCDITTSFSIPVESFLSSFDLNILMSNLLENALEALRCSEDKKLDICLRYEKNLFYISVYNTFQTPIQPDKNFFRTTKKDSVHHGYGFQNMDAVIHKYEGTSSFQIKGNLFMADIILAVIN
jgi:sensor histidine kinase YesM